MVVGLPTSKIPASVLPNLFFRMETTPPPQIDAAVVENIVYLQPPVVKCLTRVWHPNINEDGAICLSLLRENSLDAFGWRPTRNMTEVVHGLASLFTDLMDFDDPLNQQAAEQYQQNRNNFESKVRDYIYKYARQ